MTSLGVFLLVALVWLLEIYTYAILADAILSFGFLRYDNPIVRILHFITEPVVAPCRAILNRILPATWRLRMRLDLSPMLAMFLVQGVRQLVIMAIGAIYS